MKNLLLIMAILFAIQTMAQYPKNIAVGQIQATDPEGGDILFKIIDGDPQKYFWVSDDGVLMVKRGAYETFSRYRNWTLVLIASDPEGLSTKFTVVITLRKNNKGQIVKPNPEQIIA